ncbi:aldehyde dehydrogenase family protein [Bradyrhizobium sp. 33ap4]|uniref:aldehyde dehydrogenase family protein n=1 Tax=Bradyrhizobium sp. 33ap4 TaxID=3061630 RepID=UPI00292E3216|nr:aldehyde dehydrogenase family protein [Bradyrhizobium sp. 33ap4]
MEIYRLFIDGIWQDGVMGTRDIVSPSTEKAVARIPVAGLVDLGRCLAAAVRERDPWAKTDVSQRAAILRRTAEILARKIPHTVRQMVGEQGKTLSEASDELDRSLETFLWNARQAEELCKPVHIDELRTLLYDPVGVVAAFTPWNYPAVITARKLAPALAAGCTVILKAAEEAPAAAVAIIEALHEAGVPRGVVALVFGDPPMISTHLLGSPEVRMVTFTGSTRVGKELAVLAARNLQTCVLELGGHSPVLVFEDADISTTVRAICEYKFEYAGQSCNAPSRIFVQRSRYLDFARQLVGLAAEIRVGPGEDPDVQMGPMIGPQGPARMQRLTEDAVEKGACLALGGHPLERKGYFWPPTVLTDVPSAARIMSEEPFGPILAIAPFETLDQAIELANLSSYGLASYVFTLSEKTQRDVVERLSGGSVSINILKGVAPDVPITGTGDSGYGHEGGQEGFRAFQSLKLINRTGR